MNISSWSIKNPVPALLCFVLLTVFGLIGFNKMGIQDFPDMDIPMITINAVMEGAAPAQLETEVARKIEDQLTSLPLMEHITTIVTDGSVSITVSYNLDKDPETALNEVRNAVDGAMPDLPAELETPTVSKNTESMMPMMTYLITAPNMDEQDLSWFIDNDITNVILEAQGVAKVLRVGGVDREILVELDWDVINTMGLTAASISQQLRLMQKDNSGGRGDVGGLQQSIRTLGAVKSVEELAAVSLALPNGKSVRLDQIARLKDTYQERSSMFFINGERAIGIQIRRSLGFSDVTVAGKVREKLAKFQQHNPQVKIEEVSNNVDYILHNYDDAMHMLYEGAFLAIVVVWLFLKDWRSTFVAATALPLSIIPTFGVMYLCGYSLNVVTLLALSLVVGILVDDAIVEIENINRHLQMGKSPYQAAMEAADEIGLAVIATTFTLVAVFLPTAFMGGLPGLVFRQFGITASVAVLASLLVARLLTPMMAAYMLHAVHHVKPDSKLMLWYQRWVQKALRRRFVTLTLAVLFFIGSIALIPLLPTGFMPAADTAQTQVSLELPPGTTLAQIEEVALAAAQRVEKLPEVTQVVAAVGAMGLNTIDVGTGANSQTATLLVKLSHKSEREKQSVVEQKMRAALADLPGVRITIGMGGSGESFDVTIASDDTYLLTQVADQLEEQLRSLKGVGAITSGAALERPEIQFIPDFDRAAALGVSSTDIANTLRVATSGEFSAAMPKLNLPQRQVPIRVRLPEAMRADMEQIGQLRVPSTQGGTVALASVTEMRMGSSASQIDRIDRKRNVTFSIELNGRPLGDVNSEVMNLPIMKNLPQGISIVNQGELQRMEELFSGFSMAMAVGVFCIYAVLVLLFHDFLQPATILAALPLSIGGALLALLVTNNTMSMPAIIGLLMLMGIVTKNSILLVEYAIEARRRGMARLDALLDACHKRAQPIVMTTIAMVAGMVPLAVGFGNDPSFRQPMGIVVIGGLIMSTILCLIVIPVLFTYVDDFEQFLSRRVFKRAKQHAQTAVSAE